MTENISPSLCPLPSRERGKKMDSLLRGNGREGRMEFDSLFF